MPKYANTHKGDAQVGRLYDKHKNIKPAYTIKEIRDSLNKAWVLGDNRFKLHIEDQSGRQVAPLPNGGDRKSAQFKENYKNQLL
jgi:hypothetical protein